jgi:hypothetical protein
MELDIAVIGGRVSSAYSVVEAAGKAERYRSNCPS